MKIMSSICVVSKNKLLQYIGIWWKFYEQCDVMWLVTPFLGIFLLLVEIGSHDPSSSIVIVIIANFITFYCCCAIICFNIVEHIEEPKHGEWKWRDKEHEIFVILQQWDGNKLLCTIYITYKVLNCQLWC